MQRKHYHVLFGLRVNIVLDFKTLVQENKQLRAEIESLRTAIVKHRDLCTCDQYVGGLICPPCREMLKKVEDIESAPVPYRPCFIQKPAKSTSMDCIQDA